MHMVWVYSLNLLWLLIIVCVGVWCGAWTFMCGDQRTTFRNQILSPLWVWGTHSGHQACKPFHLRSHLSPRDCFSFSLPVSPDSPFVLFLWDRANVVDHFGLELTEIHLALPLKCWNKGVCTLGSLSTFIFVSRIKLGLLGSYSRSFACWAILPTQ